MILRCLDAHGLSIYTESCLSCFCILAIMNTPAFLDVFLNLQLHFSGIYRVGSWSVISMRIPIISGANSWDFKGKLLPEQAAWTLGVGLCTLLGSQVSP